MKLLSDTSVIVQFLRSSNKQESLLYKLVEQKNELFVSVITHTELWSGKSVWEREKARNELNELFSGLKLLSLDLDISKKAGEFKARVHDTMLIDCVIAATGFVHGLDVVTLNNKDFERIKEVKLYKL